MTVEITRGWAYALARAYTRDRAQQDDLAQEALIAAWRASTKGHRGGNQARAARQRLIDLHGHGQWLGRPTTRGKRSVSDVSCLELVEERAMRTEDTETQVDVRKAVRGLDPLPRRIVWLRIWEDKTWDEIAQDVGISRPVLRSIWETAVVPLLREALA